MDGEAGGEFAPAAGTTIDERALDEARLGFHRAHPRRSAKRVFFVTQIGSFLAVAGAGYWAWREQPELAATLLYDSVFLMFALAIGLRLLAASSLSPSRTAPTRAGSAAAPRSDRLPIYTILCPLYREANVVGDLAAALDRLAYR